MTPEEPKNASRLTNATRSRLRDQLASGADDTNPDFLYSTTATALLLAVEAGLIDPVSLARAELAGRGLDANGDWVGFAGARQIHLGLAVADCTDTNAAQVAVAEAARRFLHIESLASRNADALDFHELAVWSIREALAAAFEAGAASATNHTTTQED
ncbi:MAG: hypothetical protein IPK97_13350 [Ahniella sp.]|nr:hypothetical protein [Ahniella sp.]